MNRPESVSIGRMQPAKNGGKTGSRVPHVLLVLLLLAVAALTSAAAPAKLFPDVIPLPNGFQPEGIATGLGASFYVGSRATGAIFRGNLATGEGEVLVPGQEGGAATGMKVDKRTNYLFVSGAATGMGTVHNAGTGEEITSFQLASATPTFINDVIVTWNAAYFTDSRQPVLYKVPLGPGGMLPDPVSVEEIPLSGDFQFDPMGFNTNGIAATLDGQWLIIVHSVLGVLYRVDPTTGVATEIDLMGGSVEAGDGLLLHGRTLFVVQNRLNQIAVVQLDHHLESGMIVRTITDPDFRVPTTVARFGITLYVVNARFDVEPTPETEYEVVKVPMHHHHQQ